MKEIILKKVKDKNFKWKILQEDNEIQLVKAEYSLSILTSFFARMHEKGHVKLKMQFFEEGEE